MRDFFINSLEILVSVIVVLLGIAVLGAAAAAAFGGGMGPGGMSGPLAALGILIGGALYVIFIGGFMYMGIGIYQNTKRTADAVERMSGK
ncbi:MAG: hypothetical protein ABI832_06950 [bacterium]